MNITEIFIRRPVMTTLVMLGIVIFGVVGYRTLPVSDLPNVDFPTIQVSASLPGASPEMMAASVATPLERQFSTIPGIDSMTSSSSLGSTSITLQFTLDRNLDAAAQDVQTAIATAQRRLPPGMPSPPTFRKVNPADMPILMLSLNSPTLPLSAVNEYAENMIAQRISMISGVAQVNVYGAMKYAVRAQVDPTILASRGIAISDVANAISEHNVNMPSGTLWGPRQAFTVQATGQLTNAEAYRSLVVAYRNGAPVRLEELGRVIDSVQNDKAAAWFNDARSITLAIQRQPGTNTVEVVDSVKELLPSFRELLPPSVNMDILIDRSESIRESVNDVKFTLLLTVILVVLVIFIFLRNVTATLIPSLALPMSIIGTFAAMALLGYTLDNLSLMALTLSVAFVADDAIVMLENIVRHLEMGKERVAGGAGRGQGNRLHHPFHDPFAGGRLHSRPVHERDHGEAVPRVRRRDQRGDPDLRFRGPEPHPDACQPDAQVGTREARALCTASPSAASRRSATPTAGALRGVLRYRFLTLVVAVGTLVATIYLYGFVPKGFIPSQDTGTLSGSTEASQDISFDGMAQVQKQVADILLANPNIEAISSSIGSGGGASEQRRPLQHPVEAAQRAAADAGADHRELAAPAERSSGNSDLPAESAAGPHRRHDDQESVPVHAAGSRHRGALPGGCRIRETHAHHPGSGGRIERPSTQQSAGDGEHRPRPRLLIERHRRSDRNDALQRVRFAPGLDHLHGDGRLLRHPRTSAAISRAIRTPWACSTSSRPPASWCR